MEQEQTGLPEITTLHYQVNDPKANRRCWYVSRFNPHMKAYMQHGPQYLEQLQVLLFDFRPDLIIELGTLDAALTLFFHEQLPDVRLHTFDRYEVKEAILDQFTDKVTFHNGDLLRDGNLELFNLLEEESETKKFVYLDNGNKPRETELYSWLLSKGDMIGLHDWDTEYKGKPVENLLVNRGFLPTVMNLSLILSGDVFSRFFIREAYRGKSTRRSA